jgi:putative transposase
MFNQRRNHTGHLFQGRVKGMLIQKDNHLLEVCRYVVLNPERAAMVERPEQWKGSSYPGTVDKERPWPCLTTDWLLWQFSEEKSRAEKEYKKFVKSGIEEESIWRGVQGQILLGEEDFINSLLGHLKTQKCD